MTSQLQGPTTAQELQEILYAAGQEKTVLLDFTAKWCGPCKGIKPLVHELAQRFSTQFVVCEVDVDVATELRDHFQVRSMPTFVFIRQNKVFHQLKGANAEELTKLVTLVAGATFPQLIA